MRKTYKYTVGCGWLCDDVLKEFKSLKKAIAFVESQKEPDLWWIERVAV